MCARDLARRVTDRAARALNGDRRARNRVDVGADLERVANALALELLRPVRQVYGKVAVRLAMIRNDDARDLARGVHADEHLDRTVEAALERLELGRPVGEAEQLALLAGRCRTERLVVRRRARLRRERRGVRKQLLELRR